MEYARKNTVKVSFGDQCRSPSDAEMISFVTRNMGVKPDQVSHLYYDPFEKCIAMKFTGETLMKMCIEQHVGEKIFAYTNGQSTKVRITDGNEETKYVRIFYLVPEVPDREIHEFLKKFGSVKRIVHEKRPAVSGFNCYSGVRGVYMDVRNEIPPQAYICNYRCRIYYSGMQERCFICKATDHLKSECPQRQGGAGQGAVVSGLCPRKRVNVREEAMKMNFTVLSSEHVGQKGMARGSEENSNSTMVTDNDFQSASDTINEVKSVELPTNDNRASKQNEWTVVKGKVTKATGALTPGVMTEIKAVVSTEAMTVMGDGGTTSTDKVTEMKGKFEVTAGATVGFGKKEQASHPSNPAAGNTSLRSKQPSGGSTAVLVSNPFNELGEEMIEDEQLESDTKKLKTYH